MIARLGLAMFLATVAVVPAFAESGAAEAPRLVVHMLSYLKKDYGGAVEKGRVINQFEYDEQKEFAASVRRTIDEVPALAGDAALKKNADALVALIGSKKSLEEVRAQIAKVESGVFARVPMPTAPVRWPDLAHGAALYTQQCAQCHGDKGDGKGPRAATLDPKPADFLSPDFATTSPFHAYNTVRLGVPGTSMAAFETLSDPEAWALAFYVQTLRHGGIAKTATHPNPAWLPLVASKSDADLAAAPKPAGIDTLDVKALRTFSGEKHEDSLAYARAGLSRAESAAERGDFKEASKQAIDAYLTGIEPVEPRLRARDTTLLVELEKALGDVRTAYDDRLSIEVVRVRTIDAKNAIDRVETLLQDRPSSPWMAFSVAFGIVSREALEAALLLITLLGVVKAVGARRAAMVVHAGWMAAIGIGVGAWFFSGWLISMSGASRELLEGVIAAFAVIVLLYVGFWLHRTTEIGRWRAFLKEIVGTAVSQKSLWILGGVSFMAVFREVFETVLFMRALTLEVGPAHEMPVLAGLLVSLVLIGILVAVAVRFSVKLPLRQLFTISSLVMIVLATVLTGKAMRAFQEIGWLPATQMPLAVRVDLLGIYATWETILPQLVVVALSLALWFWTKKGEEQLPRPA